METGAQLATRLKEVILDGQWIARINFKEAVSDLSWQEATQQIGSFNTIAALTFHVNYYLSGVLNVLEGGDLEIRDKYSFDMPEITDQSAWENLQKALWNNTEKMALEVADLSLQKLAKTFVKEDYGDYRRNIEALIEHSYYHLGQVVLIKKWIRSLNN